MDDRERLKLDYEQTIVYFHATADVRFRLLAFVAAGTATAIGLLGDISDPCQVAAVGLLGLLLTVGILFYDQRNTQIYNAMQIRAKCLEILLGFAPVNNLKPDDNPKANWRCGGAFLDRPSRGLRFLGRFLMWHDRGLALVYGAALGGWSYLLLGAVMRLAGLAEKLAGLVALGIASLVMIGSFLHLESFDEATDELDAFPDDIRGRLLDG